jgi:hypothetical protein
MFCWEARASLDRQEAGWLAAGEARRLQAHLTICAVCSADRRRREDLVALVRESGRAVALAAPDGFEASVLRAARARAAASAPVAAPRALPWLAPFPVAAAAAVVMAALMLSVLRAPAPENRQASPPALASTDADDMMSALSPIDDGDDRIAPPREIPFTIRQDLVGTRRGRIPSTTYVLEPPPAETMVVRASL